MYQPHLADLSLIRMYQPHLADYIYLPFFYDISDFPFARILASILYAVLIVHFAICLSPSYCVDHIWSTDRLSAQRRPFIASMRHVFMHGSHKILRLHFGTFLLRTTNQRFISKRKCQSVKKTTKK